MHHSHPKLEILSCRLRNELSHGEASSATVTASKASKASKATTLAALAIVSALSLVVLTIVSALTTVSALSLAALTTLGSAAGTAASSAATSTATSVVLGILLVVAALANSELLAVILGTTLRNRHQNGLVVSRRSHGADTVDTSREASSNIG